MSRGLDTMLKTSLNIQQQRVMMVATPKKNPQF